MSIPAGRPVVLYAEDNESLAATMAEFLDGEGYTVHCAADGVEALEIAQCQQFDVLVTDLDMPRLGGLDLVQRLRKTYPAVPIVVLSGRLPVEGRAAFLGMGDGPLLLLPKPASLDAVETAIKQVFSVHKVVSQRPGNVSASGATEVATAETSGTSLGLILELRS